MKVGEGSTSNERLKIEVKKKKTCTTDKRRRVALCLSFRHCVESGYTEETELEENGRRVPQSSGIPCYM